MSVPAASTLGSLVEWALLMTSLRSSTRHASLIAGEEEEEEEEEEESNGEKKSTYEQVYNNLYLVTNASSLKLVHTKTPIMCII